MLCYFWVFGFIILGFRVSVLQWLPTATESLCFSCSKFACLLLLETFKSLPEPQLYPHDPPPHSRDLEDGVSFVCFRLLCYLALRKKLDTESVAWPVIRATILVVL